MPTKPLPAGYTSGNDLRRALFPAPVTAAVHTHAPAPATLPDVPPPSAPELLEASPSLQRLCESYHRLHGTMVERSRRQRIGIAFLVAGLAVGAFMLNNAGVVTAATVNDMVLCAAGASVAALAVLAVLWLRDDRRLRDAQGPRLLRALQTNCDLPSDRLMVFRMVVEPTVAFFDCYDLWRSRNVLVHNRLAPLLALFRGRRALSG